MMNNIMPEKIEKIRRDFDAGYSISVISSRYNVSRQTVNKYCVGRQRIVMSRPRDDADAIISAYYDGDNTQDICTQYRIANSTLGKLLLIYHCPSRPPVAVRRGVTNKCTICGRIQKRHLSRGMCSSCYSRFRRDQSALEKLVLLRAELDERITMRMHYYGPIAGAVRLQEDIELLREKIRLIESRIKKSNRKTQLAEAV